MIVMRGKFVSHDCNARETVGSLRYLAGTECVVASFCSVRLAANVFYRNQVLTGIVQILF